MEENKTVFFILFLEWFFIDIIVTDIVHNSISLWIFISLTLPYEYTLLWQIETFAHTTTFFFFPTKKSELLLLLLLIF